MFKSNYWLKSGTYTILQRFFNVLFGFGAFAILVRVMPKNEFGVWALFASVTSLIEVARIGLIQNALIKFLSTAKDDEYKEVLNASFSLNAIVTLISVAIIFAIGNILGKVWSSPEITPMLYLYSITTIALMFFHQFNYLQQANLDFRGFFMSNFVRQGSFFVLVATESFVFGNKPELKRLVFYMTLSAIAGSLSSFLTGKKYFKISRKVNFAWIKKLFNYGKYVFGTNISSMVFTSIDQFTLGALLPSSSVALFNTANRVTNIIDVPVSSVAAIVFPQSAKRSFEDGKEAVRHLYEKSVGVLLAILLPGVFILFVFSDFVITFIAGKDYLASAAILQVILLVSILQPFIRQFGTMMDSIGKPKINFYLILLISLMNIVSNYFFISSYGTIGAAYGTLATTLIFVLISQIILKKELGTRFHAIFVFAFSTYREITTKIISFLKSGKILPVN